MRTASRFHALLFSALVIVASIVALAPASAQQGKRVQVTGEVVDTFCSVTGIMFGFGTAHHQCAVWCALGGVPVGIKATDGHTYLILRIEEDDQAIENPRIAKFQTHAVTVDAELLERDGIRYLLITKVADDKGVINMTHDEHGIQPFGH
ncbi:MAG: hypothetical protein ACRCTD_04695 [Beijerinckiaceae bacterium]